MASMDPIMRIWSMGDTWHKAAARPNKPIILIGMWLLFGQRFVLSLYAFLWTMASICSTGVNYIGSILTLVIFAGFIVLHGAILFKITRNYLRYQKHPDPELPDVDDANSV